MEESKKCNHVFRILCILAFEYTSQVLWSGSTWPRTFSSECGLWDATHKNLPCFRWYFCKTLQPTSIHEQISNGRRKRSAKFTKRLIQAGSLWTGSSSRTIRRPFPCFGNKSKQGNFSKTFLGGHGCLDKCQPGIESKEREMAASSPTQLQQMQ